MSCADYAKLGKYLNIMMPVKKEDFNKSSYKDVVMYEGFTKPACNAEQKNYCNNTFKTIPTRCVINENNEAICEVGTSNNYQNQIVNIPSQTVMGIDSSR